MKNHIYLTKKNIDRVQRLVSEMCDEQFIIYTNEDVDIEECALFANKNCLIVRHADQAMNLFSGIHPRMVGFFPQYTNTGVGVGQNITYSFIVDDNSPLKNWKGETWKAPSYYGPQSSEEYGDSHNHTQGLLVEGWSFSADVNMVSMWGDALAARSHTKVWGGFLSARSNFLAGWHPYTPPISADEPDVFDAQLIGLEVDVLNGGLDSGERTSSDKLPLAKNGVQIVGFGKRNSAAIEIRCEDSDDMTRTADQRRGAWDYILVARNSVSNKSTFICSEFSHAYRGIDFSKTLYSDGAIRIRSEEKRNGIVFNDGSSAIYEKEGELFLENRSGSINIVGKGAVIPSVAKQIFDAYRARHADENLKKFALYFGSIGVSYTYIPKNGCTTLKKSLAVANGTMDPNASPHGLEEPYLIQSIAPHLLSKRLIVLRNPFMRLVSAYLDKIAKPVEDFGWDVCFQIIKNQRQIPEEEIPQTINEGNTPTFREFVDFLSRRSDRELNEHWRSQCSFFTFEQYDEIFALETLQEPWVASCFAHIPLVTSRPHATTHGRTIVKSLDDLGVPIQVCDVFGGMLRRAMEDRSIVPATDLFFADAHVLNKFCSRYADDIVVYRSLFPVISDTTLFHAFSGIYPTS